MMSAQERSINTVSRAAEGDAARAIGRPIMVPEPVCVNTAG